MSIHYNLTDRGTTSNYSAGTPAVPGSGPGGQAGRSGGHPGDHGSNRETGTLPYLQKCPLSYREACPCAC